VRIGLYQKRKDCLVKDLQAKLLKMTNKAKYIQEVLNGTVDLRKKKKDEIMKLLQDKGYQKIIVASVVDEEYKYLVRMPMDAVSEENVEKLINEHKSKTQELATIKIFIKLKNNINK
jgi:DNA topoisomerase-2